MNKKESYVLSVSERPGCYRHISVPCSMTLEELSEVILDIFEFDNDHGHAFFMDNRAWSSGDSYYSKETAGDGMNIEESEFMETMLRDLGVPADVMKKMNRADRRSSDVTMGELGLEKGRKFLYIFDFGTEWTFNCRVLRVEDGENDEITVLRSKGDPPDQYGSDFEYEDEEYEE